MSCSSGGAAAAYQTALHLMHENVQLGCGSSRSASRRSSSGRCPVHEVPWGNKPALHPDTELHLDKTT